MKILKQGFILFVIFSILTGVVYPVSITIIAQLIMKDKANGSLIKSNGRIIGSELIGQKFISSKYFHGRPSATDYSANISGASNLGPTSKKLFELVEKEINKIKVENNLASNIKIPADLVLASASGLDPHVSLESALLQAQRVANERGISREDVVVIIKKHIERPQFGFLGQERVNVLKLNLELDRR